MSRGEFPRLSARGQRLYEELSARAIEEKVPCLNNPGRWVDYEEPPTPEEAEAMCFGCPLRRLCGAFADESHAGWGIYDGRIYGEYDG